MSDPSGEPQPAQRGPLSIIRNGAWIAVVLAAVLALGYSFYVRKTAPPDIGGAFSLTDQTGKRVSSDDLKGKVLAIYFGFTHCPDECPTTLQKIQVALGKLPEKTREQVVPIFITLDPERDTREVIGDYISGFIPDGLGLTGTPEEIAEVAREYRMAYRKVPTPGSALPYTIDHASLVYVMGRDGKFLHYYPSETTADQLADGLKVAVAR